ncbi:hypothetical protein [Mucilaginibacter terrae]|uniref:Uncharacterized protein n=1 Tax=Mucilaginibacter terrae TaxID=1955052 RepID=A0ABU3GX92_9SPHI|nr:hypothetical protein [Mucilaginibacter terrae]MDT3404275.1 hypothetical protein [Mucilaginibacter terrae]
MLFSKHSPKSREARDRLAHWIAGFLIRSMRRIALWLNDRFNQFPRKIQLRCFWAFVALISLLIGVTSLKFRTMAHVKITAYRPAAIGQPSPAVPHLIQEQVTDSLTKKQ